MYADVYSLGFGPINVTFVTGTFALRNLQALYGYRVARIPDSVLAVACGPLGKWTPASGKYPLVEIVPFHDQPKVWSRLPPELRTPELRKRGIGRPLEHVTDTILERMFPEIFKQFGPKSIKDVPLPRPAIVPPSPIRNLVRESLPESAIGSEPLLVDEPTLNIDDVGPRPDVGPDVETVLSDATIERPNLFDEEAPAADGETCIDMTASGRRCQRKATSGAYCGGHAKKHAAAN